MIVSRKPEYTAITRPAASPRDSRSSSIGGTPAGERGQLLDARGPAQLLVQGDPDGDRRDGEVAGADDPAELSGAVGDQEELGVAFQQEHQRLGGGVAQARHWCRGVHDLARRRGERPAVDQDPGPQHRIRDQPEPPGAEADHGRRAAGPSSASRRRRPRCPGRRAAVRARSARRRCCSSGRPSAAGAGSETMVSARNRAPRRVAKAGPASAAGMRATVAIPAATARGPIDRSVSIDREAEHATGPDDLVGPERHLLDVVAQQVRPGPRSRRTPRPSGR